jgi:hypothetical protein
VIYPNEKDSSQKLRASGRARVLGLAETLIPLPGPRSQIPRVTRFRSTWLASSIRVIREHGHLVRYFQHLPREHHESMRAAVGVWLPIEVMHAHYAACDALALPTLEVVQMGAEAMRHAYGSVVDVTAKLVSPRAAGPVPLFAHLPRFWDRIFEGGAIAVKRMAEQEAQIEAVNWTCAVYPYCRVGMRGVIAAFTETFAAKAYVQEIPDLCTPITLGYRVSWV